MRRTDPALEAWLARDVLSSWIANGEGTAVRRLDARDRTDTPLVQQHLAPETIARARWLVARRKLEIAMLATMPRAIAHNDLWTTNAFCGDGRAPLVIDWSMCGYAPLGSDPANVLFDSARMFDISCSRLATLVPLVAKPMVTVRAKSIRRRHASKSTAHSIRSPRYASGF